MSRLRKPLNYQVLWSTGDLVLRAEVELLLKDSQGNWQARAFRVDTASDLTTMPAHDAQKLGLPIPGHVAPLMLRQTGLEVRSGYLRCRVAGMDHTEYAFPCLFLGDPAVAPDPSAAPATLPRCLLGLSGVINQLRISFDGDAGPGAPYGYLVLEKK